MNIKQVPKIELHLHLDSSLSYNAVRKLDPGITKDDFSKAFVAPPKCTDLKDYLKRVERQVDLLQTEYSLKLATEELVHMLEEDNIIYAEIRFAPLLHTRNGLDPRIIVETVLKTIEQKHSNLKINLILCNLRYFSEDQSMETARLVKEYRDSNVVGIDLAGDEKGFSLKNHIPAYRFAMENKLHRTAHAGEAGGPVSVRETLEKLKPARIGHGVRSFEDFDLLNNLIEHNIHLEICPTSNIQTNVYERYSDHTIDKLFQKGISLSVNTDGRTTSNLSLSEEYEKLQETFGWDKDHFLKCNLNAVEAAFIPFDKKARLKDRLREAYAG